MPAVLFGSISALADTSELQREAFNAAFAAHDLDWRWERDAYAEQLEGNGGAKRIAAYAEARGQSVDAEAIHQTKSELFRERLADSGVQPRPGVAETVEGARERGVKVGFVTTTSAENVSAVLDAVASSIERDAFDVVLDASDVTATKPDPAVYDLALERLAEPADQCVAIEDNVGGVDSAKAAGLACIAFPNENTAAHDFGSADQRVDRLDPAEVGAVARGS